METPSPDPIVSSNPPPPPPATPPTPPAKSGGNRTLLIILALLAVIVLLLCGCLILGAFLFVRVARHSEDRSPPPPAWTESKGRVERPEIVNRQPGFPNLQSLRDSVGKSFVFEVTGRRLGQIWGDGIYSDDSDLGTVAVHAGILKDGQTGKVKVTILPGQSSYSGTSRNGVTSSTWSSFGGSFRIEAAP